VSINTKFGPGPNVKQSGAVRA